LAKKLTACASLPLAFTAMLHRASHTLAPDDAAARVPLSVLCGRATSVVRNAEATQGLLWVTSTHAGAHAATAEVAHKANEIAAPPLSM
jgi:hypothetical protein